VVLDQFKPKEGAKMNKTISAIATAAFALAVGSTQPGCSYLHGGPANPGMLTTGSVTSISDHSGSRESKVRKSLEDILPSVHNVRMDVEYLLDGSTDAEPKKITGFGTAFAYSSGEGETHLVTAMHVVYAPDSIIAFNQSAVDGADGVDAGSVISVLRYVKVKHELYLTDGALDSEPADDIPVSTVSSDADQDIAILRAGKELPVSDAYRMDPDFRPRILEDVFLVGYPRSFIRIVTKGIVSNAGSKEFGKNLDALDINASDGSSGSPYFVERDGELYWAGIVGKVVTHPKAESELYALGTPLNEFDDMLDDEKSKIRGD